jgi:hypothetical protein
VGLLSNNRFIVWSTCEAHANASKKAAAKTQKHSHRVNRGIGKQRVGRPMNAARMQQECSERWQASSGGREN